MIIDNALKIQGWMSEKELIFLAKTAKFYKKIVEIGCYQGRSTRAMADNLHKDGVIYAVDPWNAPLYNKNNQIFYNVDDTIKNIFYLNLKDHIKNNKVIMCPYKFHEWPIQNKSCFKPDFIFIDGDHRYDSVIRDISIAMEFDPIIIAGHDYSINDWPEVVKAVDLIFPKAEKEGTIWWTQLR